MESPTHVGNTRCHRTMRWRTSAHPHACGEYAACEAMYESYRGSSPRVWGIPGEDAAGVLTTRFIPTRVGNTSSFTRDLASASVHPHACGEYIITEKDKDALYGSSPRVWGIRQRDGQFRLVDRFIPTRVGNTAQQAPGCIRGAVHPHACGEYHTKIGYLSSADGSSPRVWGILLRSSRTFEFNRFIPTRVGNTSAPHVTTTPSSGSSPRVWGILAVFVVANKGRRFIPTRVGNTAPLRLDRLSAAVHPHACGEYGESRGSMEVEVGSSPRVWGIPFRRPQRTGHARFIPTRVGNTRRRLIAAIKPPVHPHACGEYKRRKNASASQRGSSPRVWGIRGQQVPHCLW